MGILDKFKKDKKTEIKENIITRGFTLPFYSNLNTSNQPLNHSAVYRSIRLLTDTISTLPIHLYQREKDYRRIVTDHPLAKFINNPFGTIPRNVGLETMQGHLELKGKAFAEIVHDGKGYPERLSILDPDYIRIQYNQNNEIEYVYNPTGQIIPNWKMLHLIGYGWDGYDSYSPITLARKSIQIGLDALTFSSNYYQKGTNLGGVVSLERSFDEEEFQRLKQTIKSTYSGLQNSHGVMILNQGAKFDPVKINLADSQFLESRKFDISEIARWFGIPPHLIGDMSGATFSNIEQQSIEAVRYTFRPRVIRWEETLNRLIPINLRNSFYFKFNLEGLLRGDTESRYNAYHTAIQDGWLNADEIRQMEDLNPMPNEMGQIYMVPLNMQDRRNLIISDYQQTEEIKIAEKVEPKQITELKEASKNLISLRVKTGNQYKNILKTKSESIVKKEIEAIKDLLANDTMTKDRVNEIFNKIKDEINVSFYPVFESLAENLIDIVKDELGNSNLSKDSLNDFIKKYVNGFALRHTGSQAGQINKMIDEIPYSDQKEAIEARLIEWEQKTPSKIVDREIVRSREGITKALYMAAGVSKIRSVASGKSCPYCNQLDGKVIGIEQNFLNKNDELEDGNQKLTVKSNISHPPYHDGCTCSIVAEI